MWWTHYPVVVDTSFKRQEYIIRRVALGSTLRGSNLGRSKKKIISLRTAQTRSGVHRAPYSPGCRSSLPEGWSDADHSAPSSADVKNEWSYTSSPPICLHGVDRDNFYQRSSTNLFRSRYMSLWHSHAMHVRSFWCLTTSELGHKHAYKLDLYMFAFNSVDRSRIVFN